MPLRSADIDALLKDGIALAKARQRFEAHRILQQVIDADPERALAWMWLATVTEDRDERIAHLERALTLDPTNEAAHEAYVQLAGDRFVPPPVNRSPLDLTASKLAAILAAGVLLVIAIAVFAVVLMVTDDDRSTTPPKRITSATVDAFWTPQSTYTPTLRVSLIPTITPTPRPTITPGPSPTSIWDAPPPTWTVPPTITPADTQPPAPSFTAHPTSTPFIAPAVKTVTAAFVHTSDAPLEARQSATAQIEQTLAIITASPTPTSNNLHATTNAQFTQAAGTIDAAQTRIAATQTAQAK